MNCDMHAECNAAAWLSQPVDMGEGWPYANCFLKQLSDGCMLPSDPLITEAVANVTLSLKCEPTAASPALKAPMCVEVDEYEADLPASAPEAMGPVAEGPAGGLGTDKGLPGVAPATSDQTTAGDGTAGGEPAGTPAADTAGARVGSVPVVNTLLGVCAGVAAVLSATL